MRKVFVLLLLVITLSTSAQPLAQKLDSLLESSILKSSEYGLTVFDLTEGVNIYRYQDEKLYRPASVEKIITSVTAIDRLGDKYTFDTRLCYTGEIKNGVLDGSLYVVGGFDPEFMEEDIDRLVDAVKGRGIKSIRDSLVADVSMADSVYWGSGWAWDDAPFSFQPYLSPLMVNRGCVDVTLYPMQKGSAPKVKTSPLSDYYKVRNLARSRYPKAGNLYVTRDWMSGGNNITVTGNVAYITTKRVTVSNSRDFFMRLFIKKLMNAGIRAKRYEYGELGGNKESYTELTAIRRPFQEVLGRALKKSDNLCAEAIFFNLAARTASHKRVGFGDGVNAIKHFIRSSLGFNPANYNIVDGSGVSMYNYVSPQLLVEYLKYAYYHPNVFYSFYDALPVAGVDGTLKNRMKFTASQGNVRAKTGTVTGVSSLAGYAKAKNGHEYAFVIINQNILDTKRAHAFQDKICNILTE